MSQSLFSAIHWHPARCVSQIPATLIGLFTEPGELVLDPFAGSGTTAVEAQRLGRRCIATELNPVAALVIRAKTGAAPTSSILAVIEELRQDVLYIHLGRGAEVQCPSTVQASKWYVPQTARHLAALWGMISGYTGFRQDLALACFSAILLPVCRESRHWGYVCDNSTPIDNHSRDVRDEFLRVLDKFEAGYVDREHSWSHRGVRRRYKVDVECMDARQIPQSWPPGTTVKLVFTSPPYFGVTDYVKSQRLTMEWFGGDIEAVRLQEIGARSKRHRKNARAEYLDEVVAVFENLRPLLAKDGIVAVLIGESESRGNVVEEFVERLISAQYSLGAHKHRLLPPQRRQYPSLNREHLLVFSKRGVK